MQEYLIDVAEVEELQMINDTDKLEQMFTRAKSMIVQGGSVFLVRNNSDGSSYKFDELTTDNDLEDYRLKVFKLL